MNQIHISDRIQPIRASNVFRSPEYFHWCSSILRGEDGTCHLFYSRWKRSLTFNAWLTHSEIAHAVSDSPDGPYTYVNTVLDFQKDFYEPGDRISAHGPKIQCFGGKYYLYFSSTHLDRGLSDGALSAISSAAEWGDPDWKVLRENQRSYVAVADRPEGPYQVRPDPLTEPGGPIETLVVNPAAARGHDDRYYLIVKGDTPGATTFHRSQAVAISELPDRDFVLQPEPVIEKWDTEDMDLHYDPGSHRYYAVFHAHTYLGMMTSQDGLHWEKAEDFCLTEKKLLRADGSFLEPERLERPAVYWENGQPRTLSAAVQEADGDSYTVFIPLKAPVDSRR